MEIKGNGPTLHSQANSSPCFDLFFGSTLWSCAIADQKILRTPASFPGHHRESRQSIWRHAANPPFSQLALDCIYLWIYLLTYLLTCFLTYFYVFIDLLYFRLVPVPLEPHPQSYFVFYLIQRQGLNELLTELLALNSRSIPLPQPPKPPVSQARATVPVSFQGLLMAPTTEATQGPIPSPTASTRSHKKTQKVHRNI